MTTLADSPRARLIQRMRALREADQHMPWEDRDRRLAGVPRSGSTGRWYSGITPWLLWLEAHANGWQAAVWHTAASTDATVDNDGVKMGRSWLYAADRLGLQWPRAVSEPGPSNERTTDLVIFIGIPIRPGRTPLYEPSTSTLYIPNTDGFEIPADRDATLCELAVLWTRDERRIDRDDDDLEPLIGHLGGALLASALKIPGRSSIPIDWDAALANDGERLHEAIPHAERAVEYLLDLSHPELREELELLDADGEAPRPARAFQSADVVGNLGDILFVEELDLALDDDEDIDQDSTEPLVLAENAGSVLHEFLRNFSHEEPERARKNPPLGAWLAGGPGTGRNQVVAALNALFRTGGTDLGGTMVAAEGNIDLLEMVERVWSDGDLMVLPATLPPRVRVTHDRAIPTACLRAFHIRFGLSPHLWVARLEHRLLRAGEYDAFVEAFEARTGRSWRGDGHRNPIANKEAIIAALGGPAKGARRRVTHYERTRRTASWEALQDEAEWSLFHLRPGILEPSRKALKNALRRRVLFVLDLSSSMASDDPVAQGWVRRALTPLPARLSDMAMPAHRPFWFLMTPDIPLKDLSDLLDWDGKTRRKQVTVDLDQNPVTAAVGSDWLGKRVSHMRPIYRMYARDRDDLHQLAHLDGLSLPPSNTREKVLATFPFLPCVLPMAQAILDTFAGDREAQPLQTLVRKALDEQYYAPPDRFVPLDHLLEPMAKLLEESSVKSTAGARIFIGTPAAAAVAVPTRPAAFPREGVLQTVRWANRVRAFPCTAANLAPLMLTRLDRTVDEMIEEVQETLDDLVKREHLKRVKGPQELQWVRGL